MASAFLLFALSVMVLSHGDHLFTWSSDVWSKGSQEDADYITLLQDQGVSVRLAQEDEDAQSHASATTPQGAAAGRNATSKTVLGGRAADEEVVSFAEHIVKVAGSGKGVLANMTEGSSGFFAQVVEYFGPPAVRTVSNRSNRSNAWILLLIVLILVGLCAGIKLTMEQERYDIDDERQVDTRQDIYYARPPKNRRPSTNIRSSSSMPTPMAASREVRTPSLRSPAATSKETNTMSPCMSQESAAVGSDLVTPSVSTPLCPDLVLGMSTSCFEVPLNEIDRIRAGGETNINSLSGSPLLRLSIQQVQRGREMTICMTALDSTARVSVGPLPSGKNPREELGIYSSNRMLYGTLVLQKNGTYSVMRGGEVMKIVGGKPDSMKLEVTSGDGGQEFATVAPTRSKSEEEQISIAVRPNVDSVLVLACVLAVILLA